MAGLSAAHSVSLLAGTIPFPVVPGDTKAGFFNRAWLLTPDGSRYVQDKLSLTPLEAAGAGGITVAGTSINVIQWNGLRLVIIICLDSEFTSLWSRLGELDLDLVIIPAKTDMITGYNRVFGCARTRAVELQTVVCAIGAVGVSVGHPMTDTGVGGASVFVPCDVSLSLDGVFATLPPQTAAMYTDTTLHAPNLPVGACRRLRNGLAEAEVCPALWDASHLEIRDVAAAV
jgi:predicted amidohydrolase